MFDIVLMEGGEVFLHSTSRSRRNNMEDITWIEVVVGVRFFGSALCYECEDNNQYSDQGYNGWGGEGGKGCFGSLVPTYSRG